MNELTLDGKTYVSSKRAAEITGYAKDYVGQLCREGHVEARLVGRNWYVLESSIRAHRFGADQDSKDTSDATNSWPSSKYIAEEPSPLPVLSSLSAEKFEAVVPEEQQLGQPRRAILTDMEAAWSEWFTQKTSVTPEIEQVQEEFADENVPPVPIEVPIEEETSIPLVHIRESDPAEVLDLAQHEIEPEEEGTILEERVLPVSLHRPLVGNLAIQSAFIGVALVAVALALVGTGFAQKIVGTSLYRLSEINFIAGVSEINK